jgi:two-component system sensor histidine kinase RegB
MRVCVTERRVPSPADLRSAGELAPSLALPWIVKLRYGVLTGQIVLILLTHFVFGVSLPIQWLAIPLALTAAGNSLVYRCARRFGDRPALGYLLVFDALCLTALLALTGGPANPLSLLYLVYITLSAVILSKEWTWSLGGLSVLCYGFLFWAHVRVSVFEPHHTGGGFSIHLVGMWIAFVAAALLVTVFIGKVSEALRQREHEVLLLQSQVARHERLASVATLAAGAAHELGTPLATIAVASRDVEYHATEVSGDPELARDARLIRSEVERCRSILHEMSARGAEQPGELPVRVELDGLLQSVLHGFSSPDRERVGIVLTGNPGAAVLPAGAARQALTALVRNALDAASETQPSGCEVAQPSGCEVAQPVTLGVARTAGSLEFVVADSGCGMSQETLNRIAEPFFTTKPPGCGMGLGTFLVRVFAERMGGRLAFESEPGKGTRALLELPLITDGD